MSSAPAVAPGDVARTFDLLAEVQAQVMQIKRHVGA
jgi:hypothetical protein